MYICIRFNSNNIETIYMDNKFVMTQEEAIVYVKENKPAGGIPNIVNIYAGDIRLYTYIFKEKNGKVARKIHQAFRGTEYIGTETAGIKHLVGEGIVPIKTAKLIIGS
jgi:hypothetical protein